ncbi:unnamed protein product [Cylicocyclus nassatus]|uniref:Uncharacterized protein n=1 Tax=Cylicocyclus nassatus TaxID=53992 RepID=A0AA36MA25_CYLNA|nr:unnamed protein product [Cylicocyclus nassatus]
MAGAIPKTNVTRKEKTRKDLVRKAQNVGNAYRVKSHIATQKQWTMYRKSMISSYSVPVPINYSLTNG